MSKYSMHLLVCGGTECKSQESDQLSEKFSSGVVDLKFHGMIDLGLGSQGLFAR